MRTIRILLFILCVSLLSCKSINRQQIDKCTSCDLVSVREVDNNLSNLTSQQVYGFLCGFDEACKNNVEYSEYSNEVLFKLVDANAEKLVNGLEAKNVNSKFIIKQLSTPLLDYNYDSLILKVKAADGNSKIKTDVITALTNAKNRSK